MKIFLLAVVVLGITGFIAIQVLKRKLVRAICRVGAAKVYRQLRGVFGGEHVFRVTTRAEFEELDYASYDSVRQVLESRGYRQLGAVEDVTVSESDPDRRTLIELYVDGSATRCVASYQVEGGQISDVLSVLQDGRHLLTTNAELDRLGPPPFVDRQCFPGGTPIATLVSAHEERVEEAGGAASGLEPVSSLDDSIALMRRYTKQVSEYRKSIGYLTKSELQAMVSDPGEEAAANIVWAEFQRISVMADSDAEAA
ncbi:MAG: hypothetical protein R3E97_04555 [Candidatus Eisenbacteria bacterium]